MYTYLVFLHSRTSLHCGARGARGAEVRDCHKSSFINASAEMRLLCSDEGWDLGIGGIGMGTNL